MYIPRVVGTTETCEEQWKVLTWRSSLNELLPQPAINSPNSSQYQHEHTKPQKPNYHDSQLNRHRLLLHKLNVPPNPNPNKYKTLTTNYNASDHVSWPMVYSNGVQSTQNSLSYHSITNNKFKLNQPNTERMSDVCGS